MWDTYHSNWRDEYQIPNTDGIEEMEEDLKRLSKREQNQAESGHAVTRASHKCPCLEAFPSFDMPLEEASFYSPRFLSRSPSPSLMSLKSLMRLNPSIPSSQRRHLRYHIQLQKLILEPLQQVSEESKQPSLLL